MAEGGKKFAEDFEAVSNLQPTDKVLVQASEDGTVKYATVSQFGNADRAYAPANFSGLGQKTIAQNIVNGVNVMTQALFPDANTVYVILYDYDLQQATITLPDNCHLNFQGGSIKNGTINGNGGAIVGHPTYNILHDTTIKNFTLPFVDVRWFGAVSNFESSAGRGTDSAFAFQRALDNAVGYHIGTPIYVIGNFYIATEVVSTIDLNLRGYHSPNRVLSSMNNNPTATLKSPSHIFVAPNITAFTINGLGGTAASDMKATHITIEGLKVESTGESATFIDCTTFGAPSRPGFCRNVEASGFYRVLSFTFASGANDSGTNYYNFTLGDNCNFYNNTESIYSVGRSGTAPSLGGLAIQNSVLEQGASINCRHCFGYNKIENCLLEGQSDPIYFTLNRGSLDIRGNYFESNTGEIYVSASAKTSSRVRIEQNYVYNCPNISVSLRSCVLEKLDSVFPMANVLLNDVHVYDEDLLARLKPCSVVTNYPIRFPKFELISSDKWVAPDTFTQSVYRNYDYYAPQMTDAYPHPILTDPRKSTTSYVVGYSYRSITGSAGDYVTIAFWKSKGYVNINVYRQSGGADTGFSGTTQAIYEEGFYVFSFILSRSVSQLGLMIKPYNSDETVYVSKPTISIFDADAAQSVSLAEACKLIPDYYTARTGGTTSQRPNTSYYYNNFTPDKVGFTFYDTTIGKLISYDGDSWVDADGSVV